MRLNSILILKACVSLRAALAQQIQNAPYFKTDKVSADLDTVPSAVSCVSDALCSAAACCKPVSVSASVPLSAILSPHAWRCMKAAVKALLFFLLLNKVVLEFETC